MEWYVTFRVADAVILIIFPETQSMVYIIKNFFDDMYLSVL